MVVQTWLLGPRIETEAPGVAVPLMGGLLVVVTTLFGERTVMLDGAMTVNVLTAVAVPPALDAIAVRLF